MKNLINKDLRLIFLFICISLGGFCTLFAQTKGIPYQAYITNSVDVPGEEVTVPLANTEILLEFVVKDEHGNFEYIEHIPVITDQYGLVSTIVGAGYGTPQDGTDFNNINWNGRPKTLNTGIDFSNSGDDFSDYNEMPIIYIPQPGMSIETGTGAPTGTGYAGDIYVDISCRFIYINVARISCSGRCACACFD